MKRLGMFIAGALVAYFFFLNRDNSTIKKTEGQPAPAPRAVVQTPPATPPPATSPAAQPKTPMTAPVVQMPPTAPTTESKNTKEPVPTLIPFELDEHGLAIAFGDVVLGKPTEEMKTKLGQAKPAAIQFWYEKEIPYHIQASIQHPERIIEAMEYFKGTPISFVPWSGQKDALVFEGQSGNCKSYLGKMGGQQPIWLSETCYAPQIAHEIMHALGFIHEQSRTDRDEYIEILWDNIDEPFKPQFAMVPGSLMTTIGGTPFDFESIMLYKPEAFARAPGLPTLKPKGEYKLAPSTQSLSRSDIQRIFKIYR